MSTRQITNINDKEREKFELLPNTNQRGQTAIKTVCPPLATRVDESPKGTFYVGKASIGSVSSADEWQIQRIVVVSNPTFSSTKLWADGNQEFDNIWDDRTSLSYS